MLSKVIQSIAEKGKHQNSSKKTNAARSLAATINRISDAERDIVRQQGRHDDIISEEEIEASLGDLDDTIDEESDFSFNESDFKRAADACAEDDHAADRDTATKLKD